MNTPVSFEIAKLLKEKGFDIPTVTFYFKNGAIGNGQLYNWNEIKNGSDISRPTISEVVMWLYEKHGIWIYPKMSFKIINDESFDSFTPIIERRSEFDIDKLGEYNTSTEAYEAAIEYTLNNLV